MEELTEASDLVLVMGTSMGGLYADQVATECAGRALGIRACHEQAAPCLGSVIINLQQTTEDDKMTLKFSGKSDNVLVKLLTELGLAASLPADPKCNAKFSTAMCQLVPYDAKTGMRLPNGEPKMWLDLREGAKVRLITDGAAKHNHQGAKQPNTIHIGSSEGQEFADKPIPRAGQCPGRWRSPPRGGRSLRDALGPPTG